MTFTPLISTAVMLLADNIDTDQIIPARFLKTTQRNGLAEHAFADWRYDASGAPRAEFPLNRAGAREAKILVVGRNFGCGSSREHAAWALHALGIRAIISTAFADIFRANALTNGMLPVVLSEDEHSALVRELSSDPAQRLEVDLVSQSIALDGTRLRCTFSIEPFARHCLLQGVDHLGYLLDASPEIAAYESSHQLPVRTC